LLKRYRIVVEYDGSEFYGWQRQNRERTVQQELEEALASLNGNQPVTVIGSGRTDTGVHALGQVAHFNLDTTLPAEMIRNALNAKTGQDMFIHSCIETDADFHARFSARRRYYQYRIILQPSVIQRHYTWQIDYPLELDRLRECAKIVIGDHDFSRLCRASTETELKMCRIYESKWIKNENFLYYTIVGNRFLHSMVRMLVGTMIEVAKGKGEVKDFQHLLHNRECPLKVFTAPARGLFLMQVEYEC
jgi:tRNA pseudouridine38-40 synthase